MTLPKKQIFLFGILVIAQQSVWAMERKDSHEMIREHQERLAKTRKERNNLEKFSAKEALLKQTLEEATRQEADANQRKIQALADITRAVYTLGNTRPQLQQCERALLDIKTRLGDLKLE